MGSIFPVLRIYGNALGQRLMRQRGVPITGPPSAETNSEVREIITFGNSPVKFWPSSCYNLLIQKGSGTLTAVRSAFYRSQVVDGVISQYMVATCSRGFKMKLGPTSSGFNLGPFLCLWMCHMPSLEMSKHFTMQ